MQEFHQRIWILFSKKNLMDEFNNEVEKRVESTHLGIGLDCGKFAIQLTKHKNEQHEGL